MNKTVATSPQIYARIGGALYLAIIILGAFAEGFVANKLVVTGDAAATAHNILAGVAPIKPDRPRVDNCE